MKWNTIAAVAAISLVLSACGGSAAPSSSAAVSVGASTAAKASAAPASSAAASTKPAASSSGAAKPAASEVGFVNGNPYLAKPGEAPVTVKAAWCAVSAGFVQMYVMRDYGLAAKYGLKVEMSGFNSSTAALAAVQAGQVDFMYCAAAATIPGMASGIDATLVSAPLVGLPYQMVARKGINSVQDLKGKKIAINTQGDLDDRLSRAVFKQEKIPVDSVQLVPAGGQTSRYKAVLGGQVDAANVTPPLDVQAKDDGLNIIYDLSKLPIPFIYSAIHTNSKMIKEHPQTVQRFVAAIAESMWYIDGHKQQTEQSIGKQLKITDPAALDSAYKAYAETFVNRSGDVPLAAVQDSIEYARSQGTDIKRPKAADMVDSRFAADMQSSGFLEKMWGRKIEGSK